MKCPKCSCEDIEPCPRCAKGLFSCKNCKFTATRKYFEGEPLPSKK